MDSVGSAAAQVQPHTESVGFLRVIALPSNEAFNGKVSEVFGRSPRVHSFQSCFSPFILVLLGLFVGITFVIYDE